MEYISYITHHCRGSKSDNNQQHWRRRWHNLRCKWLRPPAAYKSLIYNIIDEINTSNTHVATKNIAGICRRRLGFVRYHKWYTPTNSSNIGHHEWIFIVKLRPTASILCNNQTDVVAPNNIEIWWRCGGCSTEFDCGRDNELVDAFEPSYLLQ